jgi:hypothetical protein
VTDVLFQSNDLTVPIDAFDFNGLTPLYLACVYGDEVMITITITIIII